MTLNIRILYFIFVLYFVSFSGCFAQFTKADTLRGAVTAERAWWDLQHYTLSVKPNIAEKTLAGSNIIEYKVLYANQIMQIDLQEPLVIDSVMQEGKLQIFNKISKNVYHITLLQSQQKNEVKKLTIYYSGKPVEAKRPPWDGGLQWTKDSQGNDFVATSCQGIGASIWWPCKDHMYDEPDGGADILVTVPEYLQDISNGKLIQVIDNKDHSRTYHWQVKSPINNYGINMNIGNYIHWAEVYDGEKGKLTIDYYALKQDSAKAVAQFTEVPRMLKAFEYWFGPYPFYEDGYKLVQTPYLGMEHQSSVTYGNGFKNGYLGRDLSGTGVGLLWDFIIVHESGHEWWANSLTYNDIADMWLHESFTAYSETLFTEYHFGKAKASAYVKGTRRHIQNKRPMITNYGVNEEHKDSDIYYKGANMIHTLRQWVDNDEKFRQMLRAIQKEFYHKTTDSKDVESYIGKFLKLDLKPFFNQYLRKSKLPDLQYYTTKNQLYYRWTDVVDYFQMPIKITVNNTTFTIKPTNKWQSLKMPNRAKWTFDDNYYINLLEKKP